VAKPNIEAALASVPLFEGLSKRQRRKLASLAEVMRYMEGASIVREGSPGDRFFVVLSGQGMVTVKGRTVHRILPGDHFGEIALLDGGDRTATVTTETSMSLMAIARNDFLGLLRSAPDISVALMESLARMIRRVDRSLTR